MMPGDDLLLGKIIKTGKIVAGVEIPDVKGDYKLVLVQPKDATQVLMIRQRDDLGFALVAKCQNQKSAIRSLAHRLLATVN